MAAETVSVAYRTTEDDLRAAARLATYAVPSVARIRRAAQFGAVLLGAALVLYLAVLLSQDDGDGPSPLVLGGAGGGTVVLALYSTRRFWAFHAARNPTSRDSLGDMTFQADHTGITTTTSDSSGSHDWSRIERVAESDDGMVFTVGPQLFLYVPARALSNADKANLRRLTAEVPHRLDLRSSK